MRRQWDFTERTKWSLRNDGAVLVTSHASGQQAKRYINSWKCAISHGGGITKDDGGATDNFTDDLESSDAGKDILTIIGPKVDPNGRLWRITAPDLVLA